MTLAGLTFRAIANSKNGTMTTETRMTFHLDDGLVTASYGGGSIAVGQVVGRHTGERTVQLLYQCLTVAGELRAGEASARFADDRMFLEWQWLTGDRSRGESEWVREE